MCSSLCLTGVTCFCVVVTSGVVFFVIFCVAFVFYCLCNHLRLGVGNCRSEGVSVEEELSEGGHRG